MVHSGCFLERQYCAFTRTARGQNSREFMARLVARGFVRAIEAGPVRRGRMYHVHHKPLYEAIGQADNRNRRLHTLGRMVERVMILDAVLGDRCCWWLSPADDKWKFFCLDARQLPAAGGLPAHRLRVGPTADRSLLPGQAPHRHREGQTPVDLVFLYLVNRRIPVDFRQFLIRHLDLFRFVRTWTVRLLVPRRFRKAVALYKAALREELWMPMNPSVTKMLETYFPERQARGGHLSDPDDRYIAGRVPEAGDVEDRRRSIEPGAETATGCSGRPTRPPCATIASHGCSAIEVELLNRQYLQLTGTMDRDVWAKTGGQAKIASGWPPGFDALSRRSLTPGCP